jgi:hypothetical protein
VEKLLASLYAQLPVAGAVVGYADNFLVMAEQQDDAVSTTTALRSALKAHPAGQLGPNTAKVFEPGEPIEFLGHSLQSHHGVVRIDPTPQNSAEFEARLNAGLRAIRKAIENPPRAARRAQKLRSYVMSWTGAFRACKGIDNCRSHALKLTGLARKGYHLKAISYSELASGTS